MNFKPEPYQVAAREWLLSHPVAALFTGMGLGKTATTIDAVGSLIANGESKGALVVAPLRVSVLTWPDETAKWDQFRWMKTVSLRTDEGQEAWDRQDACIYTINYESIHKLVTDFMIRKKREKIPVDTVIWDEITRAKNPGSKRIRKFNSQRVKFKRHWGLTGTPIPNSHMDLFAQIRLIDGGERFGRDAKTFKYQYCEPVDYWQRKWVARPECKSMIEDAIADIVLTQRSQDYLDIPPTEKIDVTVTLPPDALKLYKKLQRELIIRLDRTKVKAVNKGVLVTKLQQLTSGAIYAESTDDLLAPVEDRKVVTIIHDAKIEALRNLYKSEGKKPMIVATRFIHERDRICAALNEAVPFSTDKIADWNAGKIGMLVAHPASMSHGLNLQDGGCRAVWMSMTDVPENYSQLNARVARKGQTEVTKIFRMVCPGTVDDAIMATLRDKDQTQESFLEACVNNLKRLSKIKDI